MITNWLTIGDVAERLSASRWTIDRLIAAGKLPVATIAKGRRKKMVRIDPADLDRFLADAKKEGGAR